MKIVSNWRIVYKKYSVIALGLIGVAQGSLQALPQAWLQAPVPFFPDYTFATVLVACSAIGAIGGVIGAYVDQGLPPKT